jgi:hypothetical protein
MDRLEYWIGAVLEKGTQIFMIVMICYNFPLTEVNGNELFVTCEDTFYHS